MMPGTADQSPAVGLLKKHSVHFGQRLLLIVLVALITIEQRVFTISIIVSTCACGSLSNSSGVLQGIWRRKSV